MKKYKDIINKGISKTTVNIVIPACRESFLKKDAGQAGMTEMRILIHA